MKLSLESFQWFVAMQYDTGFVYTKRKSHKVACPPKKMTELYANFLDMYKKQVVAKDAELVVAKGKVSKANREIARLQQEMVDKSAQHQQEMLNKSAQHQQEMLNKSAQHQQEMLNKSAQHQQELDAKDGQHQKELDAKDAHITQLLNLLEDKVNKEMNISPPIGAKQHTDEETPDQLAL